MKSLLVSLFLLLALLFAHNKTSAQAKDELFEVPLKYVSSFLLNDEKCPLQLSNPRALASKTGHLEYFYTISNNRNSAVKMFQIEEFDAFENPSYTASPHGTATDDLAFVAYDSFSTLAENKVIISPLDTDRVTSFKLSEDRKRIWVVLVTKVTMYDGTVYDATSKFSAIRKFLDRIDDEELAAEEGAPQLPFAEKEKRLRDLLAETMRVEK